MVDKASIIDMFFQFAQAEQAREAEELIRSEGLNEAEAKRYISASLKREFASENGTEPTFRRLTIVFYCALLKPIAESLSTRGSWQMNHGLMKVEA